MRYLIFTSDSAELLLSWSSTYVCVCVCVCVYIYLYIMEDICNILTCIHENTCNERARVHAHTHTHTESIGAGISAETLFSAIHFLPRLHTLLDCVCHVCVCVCVCVRERE